MVEIHGERVSGSPVDSMVSGIIPTPGKTDGHRSSSGCLLDNESLP